MKFSRDNYFPKIFRVLQFAAVFVVFAGGAHAQTLPTPDTPKVAVVYLDDGSLALRISNVVAANTNQYFAAAKLPANEWANEPIPFSFEESAGVNSGEYIYVTSGSEGDIAGSGVAITPGVTYDVRAIYFSEHSESTWSPETQITAPATPPLSTPTTLSVASQTVDEHAGLRLTVTALGGGNSAEFQLRRVGQDWPPADSVAETVPRGQEWPAEYQPPYLADAGVEGTFRVQSSAESTLDVFPLVPGNAYEARARLTNTTATPVTYSPWSDPVRATIDSDAFLSALEITDADGGGVQTFTPAFHRGVREHEVEVVREVGTIQFRPTAAMPGVVTNIALRLYDALEGDGFTVVDADISSGALSVASGALPVDEQIRFGIVVTTDAETLEYFILVTRLLTTDPTTHLLASLVAIGSDGMTYAHTPALELDTFFYSVFVPRTVTSVTLTMTTRLSDLTLDKIFDDFLTIQSGEAVPSLAVGKTYLFGTNPEAETDAVGNVLQGRDYHITLAHPTAPDAPILTLQTRDRALRIGWNIPDAMPPVEAARIRYRENEPQGAWKDLGGADNDDGTRINLPAVSVDITGLIVATTYEVQVRSESHLENSDWASVTAAPSSLVFAEQAALRFHGGGAIAAVTLPEATGGSAPYTYTAAGFPDGLMFDADTRMVSGTPAVVSEITESFVNYDATDSASPPAGASQVFSVTVAPRLSFAADANFEFELPFMRANTTQLPQLQGGFPPYMYQLDSMNPLPPGLMFDADTATLTGAPTMLGEFGQSYMTQDDSGVTGGSNNTPAKFTVVAATPLAPIDVTAAADDAQLVIAWPALTTPEQTGGADIREYRIRWKISGAWLNSGGGGGNTVTGGATATMETVTGLTNDEDYEVQIAAVNSAGGGAWSASVFATPSADTSVSPPLLFNVTRGDAELVLDWKAPARIAVLAGGITNYLVRWSDDNDDTDWENTAGEDGVNVGDVLMYTLGGLTNGTTYQVQVAAATATVTGEFTDFMRGIPAMELKHSAAAEDILVRVGESITPVILPAASGGIAPLTYAIDLVGGGGFVAGLNFNADTRELDGAPSVAVRGQAAYKVTDATGVSESIFFNISAIADVALPAPNIAMTTFTFGITAAAQLPEATAGFAPFVYATNALPNGLEFNAATRNISGIAAASGDFTLTYSASDALGGDGGFAHTEFMLHINESAPGIPRDLKLAAGFNQITALWTPPLNPGTSQTLNYTLQWKVSTAANYATGDTATVTETEHAIPNLTGGETYTAQVRAENTVGAGEWSGEISETLIARDSALDVDADNQTTWQDGILIARYLFGLRAADLTAGNIADASATAAAIESAIQSARAAGALNVDTNTETTAADGMLIARYLIGVESGAALTDGVTGIADTTVADNIKTAAGR